MSDQVLFDYITPRGRENLQAHQEPFEIYEENENGSWPSFILSVEKFFDNFANVAATSFPGARRTRGATVYAVLCLLGAVGVASISVPSFCCSRPALSGYTVGAGIRQREIGSANLTNTSGSAKFAGTGSALATRGIESWASLTIAFLFVMSMLFRRHARAQGKEIPQSLAALFVLGGDVVSLPLVVLLGAGSLDLNPVLLFCGMLFILGVAYIQLADLYFTKKSRGEDLGVPPRTVIFVLWVLTFLDPDWPHAELAIPFLGALHPNRWLYLLAMFRIGWQGVVSLRRIYTQLAPRNGLRAAFMHGIPGYILLAIFPIWMNDAPVLIPRHPVSLGLTVGATFSIIALRITLQLISGDARFKTFYSILFFLTAGTALSFISDIIFASTNFSDEYLLYAMQIASFLNLGVLLHFATSQVTSLLGAGENGTNQSEGTLPEIV